MNRNVGIIGQAIAVNATIASSASSQRSARSKQR